MGDKPKKKKFLVICLAGNREIVAESKDDAWRKAITKGWKPLSVKEIAEEEGGA